MSTPVFNLNIDGNNNDSNIIVSSEGATIDEATPETHLDPVTENVQTHDDIVRLNSLSSYYQTLYDVYNFGKLAEQLYFEDEEACQFVDINTVDIPKSDWGLLIDFFVVNSLLTYEYDKNITVDSIKSYFDIENDIISFVNVTKKNIKYQIQRDDIIQTVYIQNLDNISKVRFIQNTRCKSVTRLLEYFDYHINQSNPNYKSFFPILMPKYTQLQIVTLLGQFASTVISTGERMVCNNYNKVSNRIIELKKENASYQQYLSRMRFVPGVQVSSTIPKPISSETKVVTQYKWKSDQLLVPFNVAPIYAKAGEYATTVQMLQTINYITNIFGSLSTSDGNYFGSENFADDVYIVLEKNPLIPNPFELSRNTPLKVRWEGVYIDASGSPVNPTQENRNFYDEYASVVNQNGPLKNFSRSFTLDSPNYVESFEASNISDLAQGMLNVPLNYGIVIGNLGDTAGSDVANTITITGENSEILLKTELTPYSSLTPEQLQGWTAIFSVFGFELTEATWNQSFGTVNNIFVSFVAQGDTSKVIYVNEAV